MKEVGRKKPVAGPVYKILEGMSMEREQLIHSQRAWGRKVLSGEGFATVADVAKPVLGPVLEGPSLE